jgi:DNA-binding MarR family transcriptional regulator
MKNKAKTYVASVNLVDKLQRLRLDMLQKELKRIGRKDISAVQALILYNVGDCEMTAGDIMSRGCYLGLNATYNLRKLVTGGYIHRQRSATDGRAVHIRLTPSGKAIRDAIDAFYMQQLTRMEHVLPFDLQALYDALKALECCLVAQHRL